MKSCTCWTIFLALLAPLFIIAPVYAVGPVATVVAARGDVQAFDGSGKSRKLTIKAPLFEEDTLQTDARSKVQIMFTDNTLISLGNATTMKIAEYRWQPERNDGALKTKIKEGTFRVMGGALALAAPQNFKTETPTATIGIRGSMYAGVATADFLSVVFQGGKGIDVTNSFGTVAISKPGYGTRAALGNPPTVPVKFSALELGELDKALKGNGSEEQEEKKGEKGPDEEGSSATPGQDNEKKEGASQEEQESSYSANFTGDAAGATEPLPEAAAEGDPVASATAMATAISTVTNLLTTVRVDASQTTLTTNVSDSTSTTSTTTNTGIGVTGKFRFFLRDINLTQVDPLHSNSTFLNYDAGAVDAIFLNTGRIVGTLANANNFGPYLISGYDPTASRYAGFSTNVENISYLDATLGALNLTSTTYADFGGQFFYNTLYNTIDSTPDYLISRLIYAGIPSTTIPTEGMDLFTGHVIHNNTSGTYYDANLEQTSIEVSYYNRRIIGRTLETSTVNGEYGGALFFGTLNSDGSADLSVIAGGGSSEGGTSYPSGSTSSGGGTGVTSSSGTATGNLYGNANQGLGFTASGSDYSLFSNVQTSTWAATGAVLRAPTTKFIDYPTSPQTYTGFVVGVADDTSTRAVSRIFMNSAASSFSMTAYPITGVISGSINAVELTSSGAMTLSGLTVGGTAANSAYISTENMAAVLSGSNLALAAHGNLLYNNGPGTPQITSVASDYLTWGYWEMAYTDPLDGSNDQLFSLESFFVTGQQTDPAYLSSIMNTSFSGTYTGKAFGVGLDSTGQNATPLTNGTTNLTVNFQTPSAVNTVTGSINFDQASLSVNSTAGALNNNGFNAYVSSVSGATSTTSAVNGAFYGPAANAVGGNFIAKTGSGVTYLGIFGGSR